jgi:hypothetical protein
MSVDITRQFADRDIVMVWDTVPGSLSTIHPDTREPFTLETAAAYAATLGNAEVMVSVDGSPFARLTAAAERGRMARLRADAAALLHRIGVVRLVVLALIVAAAAVPTTLMVVAAHRPPLNVAMYRGAADGRTEVCTDITRKYGFGAPECHTWAVDHTAEGR